ncbi:unnamed protein product [Larinioides sclopetarius]|uniref:Uncharacterized protein n=1 Tax=Larinioides sclopetarius TaxID=280406 RepID=A0AAV2BVJ5_9ARAC
MLEAQGCPPVAGAVSKSENGLHFSLRSILQKTFHPQSSSALAESRNSPSHLSILHMLFTMPPLMVLFLLS